MQRDISRLLAPRSVAIVGASPTPGALGKAVLDNLVRHGFAGEIHLINPKRDKIDGRACLKSIDDLPGAVDAAVLAIPGTAVPTAISALARRGVGSAIIFAAGFAEGGDKGLAAQAEIAKIADDAGMTVLGPNCLGLVNYRAGVPLTFVETAPAVRHGEAAVSIVSQSGAMAVVLGTTLISKGLPLAISVSTGNEAASGVEDYVETLLADDDTRVIAMIVEHFRDPARFLLLAKRAAEKGKTIVLLHPGTSSAARASAATHTGALAGDWELMRAKVSQVSVVLVTSLEELGDVVDIAYRSPPVRAAGTALLTESGAFKALALDLTENIGLSLPSLTGDTAAQLRSAIPDFIPVSNPMDLTAQALVDPELYGRTLAPLLEDDQFGAVILGIIQTDENTCRRKIPAIIAAARTLQPTKPVLFSGLDEGAGVPQDLIDGLRECGIVYFPTADRAMRALRRLVIAADHRQLDMDQPASVRVDLPSGSIVPEYLAKNVLGPKGIPFPPGGFAPSVEVALQIAADVGYPVALKAQSAALSHKSDAGGVILNVANDEALKQEWQRLLANVASYDRSIELDGVQVEPMAKRGTELIVGGKNDPHWGAAVLVGFGGVTTELLNDAVLLPTGLSRDAIAASLRGLRQGPLFDGYRGAPRLDLEAVVDLVETVGAILTGTPECLELDLNPVMVFEQGGGLLVLDALIVQQD